MMIVEKNVNSVSITRIVIKSIKKQQIINRGNYIDENYLEMFYFLFFIFLYI